jgi:hypothetical protein
MQYLSPRQRSALGQHLVCGVWAVALVGSLTIYQRAILANPRTVLQQHWEAVATEDLNLTIAQYSADAVLHRTHGIYTRKNVPRPSNSPGLATIFCSVPN